MAKQVQCPSCGMHMDGPCSHPRCPFGKPPRYEHTETGLSMTVANALTDRRTITPVDPRSRRRCSCGCKRRATHAGRANGVVMMKGCELNVRRWLRDPLHDLRVRAKRTLIDRCGYAEATAGEDLEAGDVVMIDAAGNAFNTAE